MLRLANVMQFALPSAEAFPAQHGAPPANADVANAPAASRANIVLIMCIRQHGLADIQSDGPGNARLNPFVAVGPTWLKTRVFRFSRAPCLFDLSVILLAECRG